MQKRIKFQYQKDKHGNSPFSVDDNLFHTSTEEKSWKIKKFSSRILLYQRTKSPEKAKNNPTIVTINLKIVIP